MLASTCVSHRQHFARCFWTHQVHAWVFHGQFRSDVAVDPLHVAFGLNASALGNQVVHVWRPVLNGRVCHVRTWLNNDFDNCRVQRVVGVHRSRATFDVVNF